MLTENTAKFAGGNIVTSRFYNMIDGQKKQKKDKKSGEEIVADIVKRAGLEIV